MWDEITVVEAARDTSAATNFFNPADIFSSDLRERLSNGGVGAAHNPAFWVFAEGENLMEMPHTDNIIAVKVDSTGVNPNRTRLLMKNMQQWRLALNQKAPGYVVYTFPVPKTGWSGDCHG